jgi:hypothetical protein
MKETKITISLPSLIHRIGGDHAKRAKTLAAENSAILSELGDLVTGRSQARLWM